MFCMFFTRDGGGEHVVFIVPGWVPVAWGRGCLLIGNSDKPFPEGEEGGWKRKLPRPPTPRGLVGLLGKARYDINDFPYMAILVSSPF